MAASTITSMAVRDNEFKITSIELDAITSIEADDNLRGGSP